MNALSLKKPQSSAVGPHRQALQDNLRAITDARARLTVVNDKDARAAADVAELDAIAAQMRTLQDEIDKQTADAAYAAQPLPDLSSQRRALAHAVDRHKAMMDKARTASIVRFKYNGDRIKLNTEILSYQKDTSRLLFNALREEELAGLAQEFLEKEQAFLNVFKRAFGAAIAVDEVSMSQHFGQFVGSQGHHEMYIPRPDHEAFTPTPVTPEEAQVQRREFAAAIAAEANAVLDKLLNDNVA